MDHAKVPAQKATPVADQSMDIQYVKSRMMALLIPFPHMIQGNHQLDTGQVEDSLPSKLDRYAILKTRTTDVSVPAGCQLHCTHCA